MITILAAAVFVGTAAAQLEDAAVAEAEAGAKAGAPADTVRADPEPLSGDTASVAESRPAKRAYKLTVTASPPAGGAVTRVPDKEAYDAGDTVILSASAESGYTFTGWSGAVSSRKDTLTVMMNSDKSLTASFYKRLYVEREPEAAARGPSAGDRGGLRAEAGGPAGVGARAAGAPSAPNARPGLSDLSSAYVLPGVYCSYNIREGYRKFDGAAGYAHDDNRNVFIIGASVGKRVPVDAPRLRFQAVAELGRGSVKDLEYDADLRDGTGHTWSERVSLHSVYWTGGLVGDAHILFPAAGRTFFVSAGLGAHLTYFDIAVKTVATGANIAGVSDGMRGAVSPSANLGGGVEYKLDGRGAACVAYNLRFWRSAGYKEVGELFPMGVNYTEFFYSQSIQLQYLLPSLSGD